MVISVTNSGSSLFTIDSTTAELKLAGALDFETATTYAIVVQATDGGSLTVSMSSDTITNLFDTGCVAHMSAGTFHDVDISPETIAPILTQLGM